jgi:peroxiredoxin
MEEVPLLKALHTRYAKTATIVGISVDVSVQRVDRTIKEKGMTWPILADGKGFEGPIPAAYHIQGTPEVFILDREGKIFARLGSATQIEARLIEALR